MRAASFTVLIAVLTSAPALAHETKVGSLTIEHAWARPAAKGNSAAYMTIATITNRPIRNRDMPRCQ